jgi:hypothetical protein
MQNCSVKYLNVNSYASDDTTKLMHLKLLCDSNTWALQGHLICWVVIYLVATIDASETDAQSVIYIATALL